MKYTISADVLIKEAKSAAGQTDFGGDTWKEGLDALIHSLNNDIQMMEGTCEYFRSIITQLLINRLEITRLIRKHPEILEEEIEAPIFITGLPRTGTTILQTLLALDPTSRYLRNWESTMAVCPPPELLHSAVDPRIQAYHATMDGMFQIMPVLRSINGINFMANGTAECQNLMAHEFVNFGYSAGSSLFSYGDWISDCSMVEAYQYHKQLLQVLQWKTPNEKWVLKAPMHLFGLDELLKTYPDARVVFTHRDPLTALSSGISMVYHWTCLSTQQADKAAIAAWWPKIWEKGLERALKVRAEADPARFLDIFQEEIARDPLDAVRGIYNHFDLALGKGHTKRMQAWLRDNGNARFGRHAYTTAEFELNPEAITKQFQFYLSAFGPREA